LRAAAVLTLRLCVRFLRRPVDSAAILCALAACTIIVVNAMFLQSGSHPAPFFANPAPQPAASNPARPRPAPAPAARTTTEIVADLQIELTRRGFYDGAVDGSYGPKTDAAIREFEQRASLKLGSEPNEAMLAALVKSPVRMAQGPRGSAWRNDPIADLIGPSRRVLAVQRALSDFGYGQINPSGTVDPQTNAAIERFEREHRLPMTGQISDRLVREIAAMTGRPLE
jgi:peptidoglycan hydrolase-like protein with peptidoglycan-binding domain